MITAKWGHFLGVVSRVEQPAARAATLAQERTRRFLEQKASSSSTRVVVLLQPAPREGAEAGDGGGGGGSDGEWHTHEDVETDWHW